MSITLDLGVVVNWLRIRPALQQACATQRLVAESPLSTDGSVALWLESPLFDPDVTGSKLSMTSEA